MVEKKLHLEKTFHATQSLKKESLLKRKRRFILAVSLG